MRSSPSPPFFPRSAASISAASLAGMTTTQALSRMQLVDDDLDDVVVNVGRLLTWIVNLYMVGEPGEADWVLVDTGMPLNANRIDRAARERFGSPPRAIVLTHGHFDHVGNVKDLAERWDVPVYAPPLEM